MDILSKLNFNLYVYRFKLTHMFTPECQKLYFKNKKVRLKLVYLYFNEYNKKICFTSKTIFMKIG